MNEKILHELPNLLILSLFVYKMVGAIKNILLIKTTFNRKIFQITSYLNLNEIAHNVIFVKCENFVPLDAAPDSQLLSSVDNQNNITIRVVICPKKPSYGKYSGIFKSL